MKSFSFVFNSARSVMIFTLILSLMMGNVSLSSAQMMSAVSASGAVDHLLLRGLALHAEDPFQLNFLFESGQLPNVVEADQQDVMLMVKYFLASLTIPEKDLWVNLSPGESNRITSEALMHTDLGRDLLAQDYVLKQMSVKFLSPDHPIGQHIWERLKKDVGADFSLDLLQRIWIVPGSASVYENNGRVWIDSARMKIQIEELDASLPTGAVLKEILVPAIEDAVNAGEDFAPLRRMYHAMLLAAWYKNKLKNSLMKAYIDQEQMSGIETADEGAVQKIYDQYLQAFRQGTFDQIREEYDPQMQTVVPTKYVTGGFQAQDLAMMSNPISFPIFNGPIISAGVNLKPDLLAEAVHDDRAMLLLLNTYFGKLSENFRVSPQNAIILLHIHAFYGYGLFKFTLQDVELWKQIMEQHKMALDSNLYDDFDFYTRRMQSFKKILLEVGGYENPWEGDQTLQNLMLEALSVLEEQTSYRLKKQAIESMVWAYSFIEDPAVRFKILDRFLKIISEPAARGRDWKFRSAFEAFLKGEIKDVYELSRCLDAVVEYLLKARIHPEQKVIIMSFYEMARQEFKFQDKLQHFYWDEKIQDFLGRGSGKLRDMSAQGVADSQTEAVIRYPFVRIKHKSYPVWSQAIFDAAKTFWMSLHARQRLDAEEEDLIFTRIENEAVFRDFVGQLIGLEETIVRLSQGNPLSLEQLYIYLMDVVREYLEIRYDVYLGENEFLRAMRLIRDKSQYTSKISFMNFWRNVLVRNFHLLPTEKAASLNWIDEVVGDFLKHSPVVAAGRNNRFDAAMMSVEEDEEEGDPIARLVLMTDNILKFNAGDWEKVYQKDSSPQYKLVVRVKTELANVLAAYRQGTLSVSEYWTMPALKENLQILGDALDWGHLQNDLALFLFDFTQRQELMDYLKADLLAEGDSLRGMRDEDIYSLLAGNLMERVEDPQDGFSLWNLETKALRFVISRIKGGQTRLDLLSRMAVFTKTMLRSDRLRGLPDQIMDLDNILTWIEFLQDELSETSFRQNKTIFSYILEIFYQEAKRFLKAEDIKSRERLAELSIALQVAMDPSKKQLDFMTREILRNVLYNVDGYSEEIWGNMLDEGMEVFLESVKFGSVDAQEEDRLSDKSKEQEIAFSYYSGDLSLWEALGAILSGDDILRPMKVRRLMTILIVHRLADKNGLSIAEGAADGVNAMAEFMGYFDEFVLESSVDRSRRLDILAGLNPHLRRDDLKQMMDQAITEFNQTWMIYRMFIDFMKAQSFEGTWFIDRDGIHHERDLIASFVQNFFQVVVTVHQDEGGQRIKLMEDLAARWKISGKKEANTITIGRKSVEGLKTAFVREITAQEFRNNYRTLDLKEGRTKIGIDGRPPFLFGDVLNSAGQFIVFSVDHLMNINFSDLDPEHRIVIYDDFMNNAMMAKRKNTLEEDAFLNSIQTLLEYYQNPTIEHGFLRMSHALMGLHVQYSIGKLQFTWDQIQELSQYEDYIKIQPHGMYLPPLQELMAAWGQVRLDVEILESLVAVNPERYSRNLSEDDLMDLLFKDMLKELKAPTAHRYKFLKLRSIGFMYGQIKDPAKRYEILKSAFEWVAQQFGSAESIPPVVSEITSINDLTPMLDFILDRLMNADVNPSKKLVLVYIYDFFRQEYAQQKQLKKFRWEKELDEFLAKYKWASRGEGLPETGFITYEAIGSLVKSLHHPMNARWNDLKFGEFQRFWKEFSQTGLIEDEVRQLAEQAQNDQIVLYRYLAGELNFFEAALSLTNVPEGSVLVNLAVLLADELDVKYDFYLSDGDMDDFVNAMTHFIGAVGIPERTQDNLQLTEKQWKEAFHHITELLNLTLVASNIILELVDFGKTRSYLWSFNELGHVVELGESVRQEPRTILRFRDEADYFVVVLSMNDNQEYFHSLLQRLIQGMDMTISDLALPNEIWISKEPLRKADFAMMGSLKPQDPLGGINFDSHLVDWDMNSSESDAAQLWSASVLPDYFKGFSPVIIGLQVIQDPAAYFGVPALSAN